MRTEAGLWRGAADRINRWQWRVIGGIVLSAPWMTLQAGLPQIDKSSATADDKFLGVAKEFAKQTGLAIGLGVSVGGMLWIGWAAIAKFNEARNGKAEWGEVGLLGIVGAGMLLFTGYLLKEASGVF